MLCGDDPAVGGRLTRQDGGDMVGGALEAAEVRMLAAEAARMGPVVDLALVSAESHAHAAIGAPVGRPVTAAMLARDLRRSIDTTPEGWALLVAELALRAVETREAGR